MQTKCAPRAGRRLGFTLIELLVVIAIIALLLGILLPALGTARKTARMVAEQAALKQMNTAYFAYVADCKDETLPASPHWNWNHSPGNRYAMFPADPFDKTGKLWHSITKVYTSQLAGYFDYNLEALQVNRSTYSDFRARHTNVTNAATVPYRDYASDSFLAGVVWHPSWGVNGVFFGGSYNHGAFWSGWPGANYKQAGGNFYVTNMSKLNRPERLLTFASARAGDVLNGGAYWSYGDTNASKPDTGTIRPGHWVVVPPKPAPADRSPWSSTALPPRNAPRNYVLKGGWTNASNKFDPRAKPSDWGYLDGRHFGKIVASHADGHIEMLTLEQLRDMTRWSNYARKKGNVEAKDWEFEPGP